MMQSSTERELGGERFRNTFSMARGLKCVVRWNTWVGGQSMPYHQNQMRTQICSSLLALFAGLAALTAVTGCKSLPPSKPATEWTQEEARGAEVFQQGCAKCHHPTTTQGLHGPGLQAITKVKAMPSGAPPTDDRLTAVILHGHGTMPGTALDDSQLHDLLAYLHTL
jgi:mono/diheme cytochrome c family protein